MSFFAGRLVLFVASFSVVYITGRAWVLAAIVAIWLSFELLARTGFTLLVSVFGLNLCLHMFFCNPTTFLVLTASKYTRTEAQTASTKQEGGFNCPFTSRSPRLYPVLQPCDPLLPWRDSCNPTCRSRSCSASSSQCSKSLGYVNLVRAATCSSHYFFSSSRSY